MPKGYSKDLRWRIIWKYLLQKKTIKEISRELYVNIRSIERYIYLFYTTEDVSPKRQRHGPLPQMSEFEEITILETLLSTPSMYLREIQQKLLQQILTINSMGVSYPPRFLSSMVVEINQAITIGAYAFITGSRMIVLLFVLLFAVASKDWV